MLSFLPLHLLLYFGLPTYVYHSLLTAPLLQPQASGDAEDSLPGFTAIQDHVAHPPADLHAGLMLVDFNAETVSGDNKHELQLL